MIAQTASSEEIGFDSKPKNSEELQRVSFYRSLQASHRGSLKAMVNPSEKSFAAGVSVDLVSRVEMLEISYSEDPLAASRADRLVLSPCCQIESPKDRSTSPLAVFWGRLVIGRIAVSDSGYRAYQRLGGGWMEVSPSESYGDLHDGGRGYRSLIFIARELGVARVISDTLIVIDGDVHGNGEGEPALEISRPERFDAIKRLQEEAFGDAFESLAASQAYLVLPDARSQQILLLEDDGGSGKTSWMDAFTRAYPSIAAESLDLHALAGSGFSAGNALVGVIGKSVAFVDEAGSVSMKDFPALAALSTGCEKTVRFGGGLAERHRFSLKIVIAANQSDGLDGELEAVSRRVVRVPIEKLHDQAWWEAPAEGFDGMTRWDVIFSKEGMDTLTIAGVKVFERCGRKIPSASRSKLKTLSQEARETLQELIGHEHAQYGTCVFAGFEDGVKSMNILKRSELAKGLGRVERKRVLSELESICGIGSRVVATRRYSTSSEPVSTTARVVALTDPALYVQAVEKIAGESGDLTNTRAELGKIMRSKS